MDLAFVLLLQNQINLDGNTRAKPTCQPLQVQVCSASHGPHHHHCPSTQHHLLPQQSLKTLHAQHN